MKGMLIVQTTFSIRDEAASVARKVLEKKLVACAQISQGIESFYWWKGVIEQSPEYILTMKTSADAYATLTSYIKEVHSYETPEILAFAVEHVDADYLQWLKEEVRIQDE